MISFVVSKVADGEFKVAEVYYDKGGVKMITDQGQEDAGWFETLDDVRADVDGSMYRSGSMIDLKDPEEAKGLIGMPTEEFNDVYGNKVISA